MPAKKPQNTQILRKKQTVKCIFNNRGYWKSKEDCENSHSDEICEDEECSEDDCDRRHPYECKYGIRCKHNKKKECMYLHDSIATDSLKIEGLKKQFDDRLCKLENSLLKMKTDLEESNSLVEILMEKMLILKNNLILNNLVIFRMSLRLKMLR